MGRLHAAVGRHLRGVRGPAHRLAGRLLPVRVVREPDRFPRPAAAHAPSHLRRPRLARDVLLYSAAQQPAGGGPIAYGTDSLCRENEELLPSNDMDLWLLWSAAEYGLGTRDLRVFDRRVPYRGGGRATLWAHLKRAYAQQESLRGPNGGYRNTLTGDWSDFSGVFLGMNESTLVSAQLAYVYPRLAELADARGDRAFARTLRRRGAQLRSSQRARMDGPLVLARVRRGSADRHRRHLRRAPALERAGRGPEPGSGADAGCLHPPLSHRRGRPRRARRAGADRLVAVARRRGSGGDRAPRRARSGRRERRVRGRRLVRGERLAHLGAGRARGRGAGRREIRAGRARAQHAHRPRARLPGAVERRAVDRRRLPLLVRSLSRRLRHRVPAHLRRADHAPAGLDAVRGHPARRHRAHGATAIASGRACRCGASPCACPGWASTSGRGGSAAMSGHPRAGDWSWRSSGQAPDGFSPGSKAVASAPRCAEASCGCASAPAPGGRATSPWSPARAVRT